jgi:hypothetical protein
MRVAGEGGSVSDAASFAFPAAFIDAKVLAIRLPVREEWPVSTSAGKVEDFILFIGPCFAWHVRLFTLSGVV